MADFKKGGAPAKGNNSKTYMKKTASTPVEYEKDGETKTSWTNCGTWSQGDKGITVFLNSLPVNGKLFLSEIELESTRD